MRRRVAPYHRPVNGPLTPVVPRDGVAQTVESRPDSEHCSTGLDRSRFWEAVIVTGLKPASWTYAEEFVTEDEVLTAARARADEVGVVPIGNGGGAALCFVAAAIEARAVVEIGTGTGVSGVWMLRGMGGAGVSRRPR